MANHGTEQLDTVVVGAGQAGLAAGYHLARQGLSFVILDADDRVGDSWRRRWDSLRLFTPASHNGLPGLRFPLPGRSFPTKDEMADYLEGYARRSGLPVRTGLRADRLWREGDRFVVACGDARFVAPTVVVATGTYQAPHVPSFAAQLDPSIAQLHSCEYRNPSQLRDGPVLVVGAANTGVELALEARQNGHPTLLSGRDVGDETPYRPGGLPDRLLTPALWFVFSRLLTRRTPVGRRIATKFRQAGTPLVRFKSRDVEAGGVERVPRTTGVRDGYPLLDDGRVREVSNILWCTGFRPDFRWVDLPIVDGDGFPVHDRGVVTSQPGLYLIGQFFQHTLTSGLVGGVGRDAEYIVRHLARHHRPVAGGAARDRASGAPRPTG